MGSNNTTHIKLQPIQEQAARLLAEGLSQSQVGLKVGKTRVTINKWASDPEFRRRVEELRTNLLEEADEILKNGVEEAAKAIVDIAKGGGAPGVVAAQLKAAIFILDRVKKPKLPPIRTEKRDLEASIEAETIDFDEAKELFNR